MEEQKKKKQGHKGKGQKYKSLLVWDTLLKRTDAEHALRLVDIQKHLKRYGITAERHSIKRDIDDILLILNKELDFDLDEMMIDERDRSPLLLAHKGNYSFGDTSFCYFSFWRGARMILAKSKRSQPSRCPHRSQKRIYSLSIEQSHLGQIG